MNIFMVMVKGLAVVKINSYFLTHQESHFAIHVTVLRDQSLCGKGMGYTYNRSPQSETEKKNNTQQPRFLTVCVKLIDCLYHKQSHCQRWMGHSSYRSTTEEGNRWLKDTDMKKNELNSKGRLLG